jgi:streptogramin lyase
VTVLFRIFLSTRSSSRAGALGVALLVVELLAVACRADSPPEEAPAPTVAEAGAPESTLPNASPEATTDAPAVDPAESETTVEDTGAEPPLPEIADDPPSLPAPAPREALTIDVFPVPPRSRPHDVAPAIDSGVWYTAQNAEALG